MTLSDFCGSDCALMGSMEFFITHPNLMDFDIPDLATFEWWSEVAVLARKYVVSVLPFAAGTERWLN